METDGIVTAAAMASAASITAVVEAAKDAGLPSKLARLACLVIGPVLGAGAAALTDTGGNAIAWGAAGGFMAGIGAMGSFAIVKRSALRQVRDASVKAGTLPPGTPV